MKTEILSGLLIPEMSESEHSYIGVILLSVGFTLMMVLNVVLG